MTYLFWRAAPAKGNFVRLTSTNHPVRLRFATARHPSTLEGNFLFRAGFDAEV
ncbi:MAG: hypothetical protein LBB23_01055 [Rickettsiales bacterium]|nr:hypothetical protein [Rickettsiales bacterium]